NKKNIKKARKNNLTCFIADNTKENIEAFIDLYRETMDRNHASSYYYFDEEYFFEQVKETGTSETLLLLAKWKNEIIAGVMVLVGKEFSHYHLGASKTKYLELRPNNLLFDFMIEICKSKGSQLLHLGGGYQEDDGLFKFKTAFTSNNNYEYYLGKKIHNTERYKVITESLQNQYELDESYFPIYRGKLVKRKIHI
ncbi:GNAT family N-acetyltransferase, partial [Neobacillus vireti]|uniref:GNAT family N-acetyltransferase n=1 Tax=Neobacillus vireti TaxID=220686 RepID=UPI00300055DB